MLPARSSAGDIVRETTTRSPCWQTPPSLTVRSRSSDKRVVLQNPGNPESASRRVFADFPGDRDCCWWCKLRSENPLLVTDGRNEPSDQVERDGLVPPTLDSGVQTSRSLRLRESSSSVSRALRPSPLCRLGESCICCCRNAMHDNSTSPIVDVKVQ